MKKCLHCGKECEDNVCICENCGAMVDTYVDHKEYMDVYHVNQLFLPWRLFWAFGDTSH